MVTIKDIKGAILYKIDDSGYVKDIFGTIEYRFGYYII